MTSPNNTALQAIPPATFTYVGQAAAAGYIKGGVLIGDLVNNSSTTPAGSADNIPTVTLSGGVPISAQLELQSTTGALCIMRMTTTQRNALVTVVNGMMIYNTTTTTFQFYQNGAWVSLSAGAGGVVGPGGGSTDNAVARWDGAGGNTLQNSVVLIGDTGAITGVLSIANDLGLEATPSYTFTGDTNTGMYSSAANTVDFSTNALRQVSIGTVASSVNYVTLVGSATGTSVKIGAAGTDTNVDVEIVPKGTGGLLAPVGAVATPGIAFTGDTNTGIYRSAANTIDFATDGLRQVSIGTVASTVNYLQFIGSATGNTLKVNAVGTDTNIGVEIVPKGTGAVVGPVGAVATPAYTFTGRTDTGMWSSAASTVDFSTTGGRQFQITNIGTAVDWIAARGSATNAGNAALQPSLVASGSDTVVDIGVVGKGAASGLAVLPNSAGGGGSVKYWNPAGTFYTQLVGGAVTGSSKTFTLPILDATNANAPLVSNASGALSFANDAVIAKTGTLSSANILGMNATPVEILAAPPANTYYIIHRFAFELVAGTQYANGGATGLQYGATAALAGVAATATFADTVITAAASTATAVAGALAATARTDLVATAITISNDTAPFITGTGTGQYTVWYSIVTI